MKLILSQPLISLSLTLALLSCASPSNNRESQYRNIRNGMSKSEVVVKIGAPDKIEDGWKQMIWSGPNFSGTGQFETVNQDRYETWEYNDYKYDSIKCNGEVFVIDVVHSNLEIKQPTNFLRMLEEYRVGFDRTTGKVIDHGFLPIGFIDRVNDEPHVMAKVK